jgi:hypothetical protein
VGFFIRSRVGREFRQCLVFDFSFEHPETSSLIIVQRRLCLPNLCPNDTSGASLYL